MYQNRVHAIDFFISLVVDRKFAYWWNLCVHHYQYSNSTYTVHVIFFFLNCSVTDECKSWCTRFSYLRQYYVFWLVVTPRIDPTIACWWFEISTHYAPYNLRDKLFFFIIEINGWHLFLSVFFYLTDCRDLPLYFHPTIFLPMAPFILKFLYLF